MRRGCCLGCLISLVLVGACVAGVAYLAAKMDLTHEAPRIDTVAHMGGQPEVLVRLNPNAPELVSLLLEGFSGAPPQFVTAFLPHEATLAIGFDGEQEQASCVLALSLRRLTGALAWLASDPEGWRISPVQQGIQAAKEADGLWVVRSHWPVSREMRERAAAWWPDARFAPLELEGGHVLEALLDNRSGGALLALEALLAPRDLAQEQREAVVNAPFDMEAQRLPGIFRRLEAVRLSADIEEANRASVRVEANGRDEAAAESLAFFLYTLRDLAYRELIEEDIVLTGDILVSGAAVRGIFTIDGIHDRLVRAIRENAR